MTVGESSGWAMVGTSSVRPTKGGLLRRWLKYEAVLASQGADIATAIVSMMYSWIVIRYIAILVIFAVAFIKRNNIMSVLKVKK